MLRSEVYHYGARQGCTSCMKSRVEQSVVRSSKSVFRRASKVEMKLWLSLQAVAAQACANILMHVSSKQQSRCRFDSLAASDCLRQGFKDNCHLSPLVGFYQFGGAVHRQTDPGHG